MKPGVQISPTLRRANYTTLNSSSELSLNEANSTNSIRYSIASDDDSTTSSVPEIADESPTNDPVKIMPNFFETTHYFNHKN